MAEILKKQAQLFIDAFPDVDRKSPVIPEGGKIDFCKQANIDGLVKSHEAIFSS